MKDYNVSKQTLNQILDCAGAMLEVGIFMVEEHKDKVDSFRSDVLCDGVECRLEYNYKEIKKLLNIICNDGKL